MSKKIIPHIKISKVPKITGFATEYTPPGANSWILTSGFFYSDQILIESLRLSGDELQYQYDEYFLDLKFLPPLVEKASVDISDINIKLSDSNIWIHSWKNYTSENRNHPGRTVNHRYFTSAEHLYHSSKIRRITGLWGNPMCIG